MSIERQRQELKDFLQFLEKELPIFAKEVAATDLIALVTNRVVQRGINFEGAKFKPYSRTTVAAFRFYGKSRTASAEKKVRALTRAKSGLSYRDFRELNNLNTDKKNFEFSGEMWRKFGVLKTTRAGSRIRIQIGGKTTEAQKK